MKILVKIKDNTLQIINRKKLNNEYKNMLNTNVISNNELVFSDEYIYANSKIVCIFLSELIKTYNINTISFQNNEIANLIIPLMNDIIGIQIINFEGNEVITYKIVNKIIKLNGIKIVCAQYIPQYLFDLLNKYNIIAQSRSEILFTSNFMEKNELNNYSSIYYKNTIFLEFPFSIDDADDFASFCSINRYLKNIHINIPNKFNLEEVINLLQNYHLKNITIYIHGDIHDTNIIEYLKKNNKTIKKKYKIKFKLAYSEEYIQKNITKQTNTVILRTCALLIMAVIFAFFGYSFYDNYRSMKSIAKIQKEIQDYIIATDNSNITLPPDSNEMTIKNPYIAALKNINSDAVGWLKVNNTNIDYAVLQTYNNDYYLSHNIYKERHASGWIFLDYENNLAQKDDNLIIYGHNHYVNGVMFGTLNKALYKNWYTNPENQIIRLDTLYKSNKYKIFAIYIVPETSDYLTTNFPTKNAKMNFIEMIKKRSIYDFDVEVNADSQILTLSTCYSGSVSRLVVHAVLLED